MNRLTVIGVIPICAGFLAVAQEQTRTQTQTTTWDGMLVDASCQSNRTERTSTTTTRSPGSVTTRTDRIRTETVCPATPTTTTFGIMTRDGRFIRFDDASNARVSQMLRANQDWNQNVANSRPIPVQVVGTPNGDAAIVQSMEPEGGPQQTGEAYRNAPPPPNSVSYDARWKGDRGRLIIGTDTISFEDLSNGNHSRTWSYAQIKELKRDSGKEIKIQPYEGDKYELHLAGSSAMTDDVYNQIGDRIVAARGH